MGNTKVGKSGYYGVFFSKVAMRWVAQIRDNNDTRYIGIYKTIEEAARAYDVEAKKLHKKFLNFGPGGAHELGRHNGKFSKNMPEGRRYTVSNECIAERARTSGSRATETDPGVLPRSKRDGKLRE